METEMEVENWLALAEGIFFSEESNDKR